MVFITTTACASRISGILPASFPGQVTQDCQALGPVLCKARVARVDVPQPVTGSHTSPVWTPPGFQASGPHKARKHVSPKPWAPHKRLRIPSYSSSLYCGSGPASLASGRMESLSPRAGKAELEDERTKGRLLRLLTVSLGAGLSCPSFFPQHVHWTLASVIKYCQHHLQCRLHSWFPFLKPGSNVQEFKDLFFSWSLITV